MVFVQLAQADLGREQTHEAQLWPRAPSGDRPPRPPCCQSTSIGSTAMTSRSGQNRRALEVILDRDKRFRIPKPAKWRAGMPDARPRTTRVSVQVILHRGVTLSEFWIAIHWWGTNCGDITAFLLSLPISMVGTAVVLGLFLGLWRPSKARPWWRQSSSAALAAHPGRR
jgi:hypothetical protein